MRLINTRTLKLHEFFNPDEIKHEELKPDELKPDERKRDGYAILSHTWGVEEVSFQDWLYAAKQNPPRWGWVYNEEEARRIKDQKGYNKIKDACKRARDDGLSWLWVDTNCIDKMNSAELSEAINSMYQWHQKAQVCYAFLADVPPSSQEDCLREGSKFRRSRWFTRGWTLQELIAPKHLLFFSDSWTPICKRVEITRTIQEITNIPAAILDHPQLLTCCGGHASIAEIMSWASTRTTTRTEDMAYCLMGLFDVNMPLLYGEGQKALLRLQLEIIQKTCDVTFLAWQEVISQPRQITNIQKPFWMLTHMDTFAREAKAFCFSRGIHNIGDPTEGASWTDHWAGDHQRLLRINNLGLSLSLPLVETLNPGVRFAVLPYAQHGRALWMPLKHSGHKYIRLGFPSVTLSVSNIGYTAKETEITLPIYRPNTNSHASISRLRHSSGSWRRSHVNILLAFPAGFRGYKLLQKFPPPLKLGDAADISLQLCVDDDNRTIAYGAIEFERTLESEPSETPEEAAATQARRVAVLFAAELGNPDDPTPRRWTCRDISCPRFEGSRWMHRYWDLESRTRSQLAYLTDPSLDEMVISGWEHRFLLKGEVAQADHGVILLNDSVCKRSPTFLDNFTLTEVLIIAQIIFPDQGYYGTW